MSPLSAIRSYDVYSCEEKKSEGQKETVLQEGIESHPKIEAESAQQVEALLPYPIPPNSLASVLKQKMVADASQDQRNFLSGVSSAELMAIYRCYDHPLMVKIVEDVRLGRWESLIQLVKEEPKLPVHDILKAAFCQGKLGNKHPSHEGIDNLASAYIFLAPAMAKQAYQIFHFDEVSKHPEIWEDLSQRWDVNEVPENQRYFILVNATEYLPEARALMEDLHRYERKNAVVGGIRFQKDQGWALGSAGLIRKDRFLEGYTPIYGRRLRPLDKRFFHLSNGCVDIALDEPLDTYLKTVHGVVLQGNLLKTHDCYHAFKEVIGILKYPDLLSLAEKLYKLFKTTIPPYSPNIKACSFSNTYYDLLMNDPKTQSYPSDHDWTRFLVYETILAVQDGEVGYWKKIPSDVVKFTIKMIYNRQKQLYKELQPCAAKPPLFRQLVPMLNQYLGDLGIELN